MENLDRIKEGSKTPKYLQVVNALLSDIEAGLLQPGQRIPSINETSETYYLSRDTVEKAYNELRERGVIDSVRGKGYYISRHFAPNRLRVLLIFNKLSAYKKTIYYAFLQTLGDQATVDLHIHHYNPKIFKSLVTDNLGQYHYYVIMPHFYSGLDEVVKVVRMIPREKLVLLDKDLRDLDGDYAAIYQDFEKDINAALASGLDLLRKYQRLVLVYPKEVQYPREILSGFRRFCLEHSFEFKVVERVSGQAVQPGEAYVVLEETDLVDLIKRAREQKLKLGRELGILSYNETPLKEILADGITVVSTDHEKMGETAATMILNKSQGKIRNPFTLIRRNSL